VFIELKEDTMITVDAIVSQIQEVLEQLQPYFLMHGGRITFECYEESTGTVHVALSGSCDGCPSSGYTLTLLVEAELKKEVPQVMRVVASGLRDEEEEE
jgi:Fe-S cluster biogenesis protein NfuA